MGQVQGKEETLPGGSQICQFTAVTCEKGPELGWHFKTKSFEQGDQLLSITALWLAPTLVLYIGVLCPKHLK